jgi:hypothetical protein
LLINAYTSNFDIPDLTETGVFCSKEISLTSHGYASRLAGGEAAIIRGRSLNSTEFLSVGEASPGNRTLTERWLDVRDFTLPYVTNFHCLGVLDLYFSPRLRLASSRYSNSFKMGSRRFEYRSGRTPSGFGSSGRRCVDSRVVFGGLAYLADIYAGLVTRSVGGGLWVVYLFLHIASVSVNLGVAPFRICFSCRGRGSFMLRIRSTVFNFARIRL